MANPKKGCKGVIPIVGLVSFLISANFAFGETKIFLEEYTYQASEADSKLSSRVIALEQVKRLLLEKLGTYLESETEVKNFQLTKDQIVILTAGIVRAEVIEEGWDGKTYYLKAKISAEPKEVIKSIDLLRHDRQKTKELEETRKKADEALEEVEKLKKELEIAKAGKAEQEQYNGAVNRLSARDWFDKGYALGIAGRHQEAIGAFTSAIELDRKYAMAYVGRGVAYGTLGDHRQAIRDYDRAIELNPKHAQSYYNRGNAYANLGDRRQAIRDSDRAIELNPELAEAYTIRGYSYANLGDHRQAIGDSDRAIELNPELAEAYTIRGYSYANLGDHRQAVKDIGTAARLGHKPAQDYLKSKRISW